MKKETNTGLDSLRKTLDQDISRFDEESGKQKRMHRNYQRGIIILTTTTIIVAGSGLILPEQNGRIIQFGVLCLTAATAATSAWAELRRTNELWQLERDVY